MHYKKIIIGWFFLFFLQPVFAAEQARILIFVSFSMPEKSLKTWMYDADKIQAPLIIRGLINNSFKETTTAIYKLVKDGSGGMQIDPTLFNRFQIEKVPAVVVTQSESCLPNQSCIDNYDVFYGDVGLEYALKRIAREKDELSVVAEEASQKLKEVRHA